MVWGMDAFDFLDDVSILAEDAKMMKGPQMGKDAISNMGLFMEQINGSKRNSPGDTKSQR